MLFLVYQLALKIQLKIYPTSPTHPSHSPAFPPISNSDNKPLSQKQNTDKSPPIFGAIKIKLTSSFLGFFCAKQKRLEFFNPN